MVDVKKIFSSVATSSRDFAGDLTRGILGELAEQDFAANLNRALYGRGKTRIKHACLASADAVVAWYSASRGDRAMAIGRLGTNGKQVLREYWTKSKEEGVPIDPEAVIRSGEANTEVAKFTVREIGQVINRPMIGIERTADGEFAHDLTIAADGHRDLVVVIKTLRYIVEEGITWSTSCNCSRDKKPIASKKPTTAKAKSESKVIEAQVVETELLDIEDIAEATPTVTSKVAAATPDEDVELSETFGDADDIDALLDGGANEASESEDSGDFIADVDTKPAARAKVAAAATEKARAKATVTKTARHEQDEEDDDEDSGLGAVAGLLRSVRVGIQKRTTKSARRK